MWPQTKIAEIFGLRYPVIQAGMAGAITTPELVAAVSNVGGLGTLGAGYMTPEQLKAAIREIRTLTDRPFAVNLFVPQPFEASQEQIARINRHLKPIRDELGITSEPVKKYEESFDEQLSILLAERVPVISFTFGIPTEENVNKLKRVGSKVIGTATTVREAVLLEQSGVDAIVAQGSEAGGHRGTFAAPFEDALIGTMALIPQVVDHVQVPVIAAGGIMDGRGIVASLALGASGVQLGTAFLTCRESGAHEKYKEAVLMSTDESTSLTRTFSGKPARGIKNGFMGFMIEMEHRLNDIPPYPVQNALTRDIRQSAAKQNRPEWMSLWAGQASHMAKPTSVSTLMNLLVTETSETIKRLTIL